MADMGNMGDMGNMEGAVGTKCAQAAATAQLDESAGFAQSAGFVQSAGFAQSVLAGRIGPARCPGHGPEHPVRLWGSQVRGQAGLPWPEPAPCAL